MTASSSRLERLALTLSGLLAAGSVVAIAMVEPGRSAVSADVLVSAPPGETTRAVVRGIDAQLTGLTVAGALAVAAILTVCLGKFLASLRTPRDGSPWPVLLLAMLPACLGVLIYGCVLASGYGDAADVDPALKSAHLRALMEGSHRWLDRARLVSWLAIGAIAIAEIAWTRRTGPGSTHGMLIAAGFLVTGVVAFALARKQAADQSPIPVLPAVVADLRRFLHPGGTARQRSPPHRVFLVCEVVARWSHHPELGP